MKRKTGIRVTTAVALAAAALSTAVVTSASASAQGASASDYTRLCQYTPTGSVSHYFSLASGTRVVKGQYNHGQKFTIGLPAVTTGLQGIIYWKLPNGYWIDPDGITQVPNSCMIL